MRCQYCGADYEPRRRGGKFCSPKHRMAAWKQGRAKAQADREGRVRSLLAEALRELGEEGDRPTAQAPE